MIQPQTLIFIGPQGSGKGTQVERVTSHLKEQTGMPVTNIETGKAFRKLSEEGSYTAERVKELLAEGKMVPNFITKAFVVKFLIRNLTPDTHLTMDGFPRNDVQVKFVDDLVEFYKRPTLTIIHLNTPEDVVRERMKSRARADDTPELIEERLRLYRENTVPIVETYKGRDDVVFIEVDGSQSVNDVTQAIVKQLS